MDPLLDLTAERCPMTFVRVRLALDSLPAPATLHVRLRDPQAVGNVTRSATALGCTVSAAAPRDDGDAVLTIRKPISSRQTG
ncbi:TusA-related sulfurtransferase [Endobacter medicaginis]|nr:sulfurtransferase TusA family protein [Endobacter medicaginis]MBB3174568.1 TusA-related sulfurtransferase [Endobacter medicaginis]MCX5474740.1 sulfurtransferase TusA family protein [Endobacter medicaginis]